MLQSYNKLTFLDIDANIGSGGVGEAYPGSTGGEIFNYYGTDSNANVASGNYSTAIGYHCQALGNYSIACGEGCTAERENNIAIGKNCQVGAYDGFSLGIGRDCSAQKDNIAIGDNVKAKYPGGSQNYGGTVAIGRNINGGGVLYGYSLSGGYGKGAVLIGHDLQTKSYNVYSSAGTNAYYFGASPAADSFSPSSLKIGIGNNKTALESDKDGLLRFPHGFCMDSITTVVNAITSPQDPNNITADDQTLVTKSYLSTQIPSLSDYSKSSEILASAFSFSSSTPTATLTTPPAWCRVLQITVRVDGQNTTVNATYDPAPGVPHTLFEVNVKRWDSNANKLTYYWCQFEYSNTNNDITWTNWVGWDQDFSTGTITKIGDGIANFNTSINPITLMSVIALA